VQTEVVLEVSVTASVEEAVALAVRLVPAGWLAIAPKVIVWVVVPLTLARPDKRPGAMARALGVTVTVIVLLVEAEFRESPP
jgi:hypothetical protein